LAFSPTYFCDALLAFSNCGFVGATDKRKMPSFNENLAVVVVALSPVETGT
jgi:hypothetical protein